MAKPLRGDVRVTKQYPPGTKPEDIREFEVWDGERWVPNTEHPTYVIQEKNEN